MWCKMLSFISNFRKYFFSFFEEKEVKEEKPPYKKEKSIENSYIQLSQKHAEDIMIPRAEIRAVSSDLSLEKLIEAFQKSGHSRLPVYHNILDTISGIVHLKDLLPHLLNPKDFNLSQSTRKVLFASPSAKLNELLLDMQQSHTHMALIVDEHGGVDGLITIENILEELVGDIRDEHEEEEKPLVVKTGENIFAASGKASIDLVESITNLKFPIVETDEIETIGGYICFLSSAMPKEGEIIKDPKMNISFKIIQASPRTIDRVVIQPLLKNTNA